MPGFIAKLLDYVLDGPTKRNMMECVHWGRTFYWDKPDGCVICRCVKMKANDEAGGK